MFGPVFLSVFGAFGILGASFEAFALSASIVVFVSVLACLELFKFGALGRVEAFSLSASIVLSDRAGGPNLGERWR